MNCECIECKNKNFDFDYEKIYEELYGNYLIATTEADQIYGIPQDTIKNYSEPLRSYELEERKIFLKESLKFMFQLSLMNAKSFLKE